jgi:hypothetical protein
VTMAGPESSVAGAEADPAELTRPAPAAPENPDRSQRR